MDFNSDLVNDLRNSELRQNELIWACLEILEDNRFRYQQLFQDEGHNLVSKKAVRRICLKYRLRCLEFRHFKSRVPEVATERLKTLEARYKISLNRLRIIAPSEMFNLEHREKDPILLAELPGKVFLIIHKWGNEFSGIRKLKALPLRNIPTMVFTVGLIALIFSTLLIPFTGGHELSLKEFLFGAGIVWMGCMSYAVFLSFSQNIFPTTIIWNSRFLD